MDRVVIVVALVVVLALVLAVVLALMLAVPFQETNTLKVRTSEP